MYKRSIQLSDIIEKKSLFLLGPRQTGKSTLLRACFPSARYIDLLDAREFRDLSANPEHLRQRLTPADRIIIVDEVQKLPSLLDEVQLLMDRDKKLRFILTGSSARKLKRGSANLLGGRALLFELLPLTTYELEFKRINDQLRWGGLPSVIDSDDPERDLDGYVGTYLKEEIQAEGLSRSIENFSRFLQMAAHLNTQQINYTKIGNDSQISPRTVKDYVQILIDTLIASTLEPYQGKGRKTVNTEKFYFFDLGVARSLLGRQGTLPIGTPEYGEALEHLIFSELKAYKSYKRRKTKLTYWRTAEAKLEVDFVLDDDVAIEVKSSRNIGGSDLKSLRAIVDDIPVKRRIVVCNEVEPRTVEGIEILPLEMFLHRLWSGEIL